MRLKTLIPNFRGPDRDIHALTSDSRRCGLHHLFIAKRGGERYMEEARAKGAVAISATASEEVEIAKRFYGDPSARLKIVGITGSSGKTTTSYLVRHLLQKCDLIGTIETIIGQKHLPASLTTPDTLTLYQYLSQMDRACVMEVSSHALDQNRCAGLAFASAIFTNLSPEHLDYHQTMEKYFAAKAKLFKNLTTQAILNADCPYTKWIQTPAEVLTYGIDQPADLRAFDIELTSDKLAFTLIHQRKSERMVCPLIGKFNIYNCLAAIGAALTLGVPLETIAQRLSTFSSAAGRLEAVPNALGLHIFVDFAHKPDALKNVLSTLKSLSSARLLLTFGCGGDRDLEKRATMGEIAKQYADYVLITSDNPRSEDPLSICKAIPGDDIEVDRKRAIEKLIHLARPGDIVLIAGKGHETKQIFADHTIAFDDRKVAKTACEMMAAQV